MAKEVRPGTAKNIDEYLLMQPAAMQPVLEILRQAIKKVAPKAQEIISYQIPTYKYFGPLVHFAAFKDHCSLIIVNKDIIKKFEEELQSYKTTGTTIHFTPEKPIPTTLIQKIVKIRIKENEDLNVLKQAAKK